MTLDRFIEGLEVKKDFLVDPRNKLNNLNGREWLHFLKSWEIIKPKSRKKSKINHPATFPFELIVKYVKFFTKRGEWILDPFVGTGTTLRVCDKTKRNGIGIELYEKWGNIAKQQTKQEVIIGDCQKIISELSQKFKLCITSPPYYNVLNRKPTHNNPKQKLRNKKGLELNYGNKNEDLGNINDYETFVTALMRIFLEVKPCLLDRGHLIIIIQNIRISEKVIPLAFDLTLRLSNHFKFKGEKLWLQTDKSLKPFGYPYSYVGQFHHHYCLVFEKRI